MPRRALPLVLFVSVAAGCTARRTIGQPNLSVVDETLNLAHRDKVDILFMFDNSPGTSPKLAALRQAFPELLSRIEDLATAGVPASFHIGVVDSDMGAGPFTLNQGQCHPDGDAGKLRATPNPDATGAPAACSGLSLPDAFIDYDSSTGTSNVGTLDLATAFNCISAVGTGGCGFEAPLESVYRALTSPSVNPGFLRDDALLVVVWLTDEDDCSAPPDSPLFDPSSNGVATYGTLHSFRCTQWGIACDGKPLTGGDLPPTSNCAPVVGGPLFDVSRYASLFASGGIKQSAVDVLLVGIFAPPAPVAVSVTSPCADQVNTPSCPILDHSCVSSNNPLFFGDPGVRLDAVLSASPGAITASICDSDYSPTMDALVDGLGARMRAGCLPGAVVDALDPGCTVTVDGIDTSRCDTEGRLPCWDLADDGGCPPRATPAGSTQQLRFIVEGAAPHAVISATCPLYEPAT